MSYRCVHDDRTSEDPSVPKVRSGWRDDLLLVVSRAEAGEAMSKGSYPVASNGRLVGHMVYVEGRGWVYEPLPPDPKWIELDIGPRP
jgi:hypothetical protein